MKLFHTFSAVLFLLLPLCGHAQKSGSVLGSVIDKNTQAPVAGASIKAEGTGYSTRSSAEGTYRLSLPTGTYTITVTHLNYQPLSVYNVSVSSGNAQTVNVALNAAPSGLEEVVITFSRSRSAEAADMVTPLSVQQLTAEEIRSNPGGNFDVSKVVQTLPGVGSNYGIGERNDIIIRGGAPNENVYYLDGVEIPVLNHFQTQGSSGGAQGILNVSFIESLKLSSSAFDARYDNALASTFVIKQRDGNPDKLSGSIRASLTESVLTLEGPLLPKTTFLASARSSYLSLLFKMVDLPIRPDFYDFQYKVTHKINSKSTLTAIGLGAVDYFSFAVPRKSTPEKTYILRSIPYINQWNYTAGFNFNHRFKNGYFNITASRNAFDNALDKFEDDTRDESKRSMHLQSRETENKLRADINKYTRGWKLSAGLAAQYTGYTAHMFSITGADSLGGNGSSSQPRIMQFESALNFWKYGAFAQVSKELSEAGLLVSAGIRSDGNTFTSAGNNLLKTLSPRISLAYHLLPQLDLTASAGKYYKIPAYTALGFKNNEGSFINQDLHYIGSAHYVLGAQYMPKPSFRLTLEGFVKKYSKYPVSVQTGVSLANQGVEYGSIGSEALNSSGRGQTYGFEVYAQQKLVKKLFYVASYTYVRSKFAGTDGLLLPSSWDSRHLFSSTLGYKLKNNWQLGLKYIYTGGAPYTPFDMEASQKNYLLTGKGTSNYALLNSLRLSPYNQLDLRIDKTINFKRTSLNLYLDLQNVSMSKNESYPYFTFRRNEDNSAFLTNDGEALRADGSNAIPTLLDNRSGRLLPSLGLSFEF